jgi:GH35 family endo-1,4-beta-xylanase
MASAPATVYMRSSMRYRAPRLSLRPSALLSVRRPACGRRLRAYCVLSLLLAFGCTPPPSFPESSLDAEDAAEAPPPPAPFVQLSGRELPLHSSGAAEGDTWVLHESGYSGVFLRLEKRGHVTLRVTAAGVGQLLLVVGEQVQSFSVAPDPKPYEYALDLPPGTHFLRLDTAARVHGTPITLSVSSVSVSGAQLVKEASDREALDAANTFIQNYRKGPVKLQVHGADPGEAVQIKLLRHAFDFGVNVPGAPDRLLVAQPPPDSEAARFQELVLQHFNTLVLTRGGEWIDHERERDQRALGAVDRFLAFARDNALHARLHALLGDSDQQPSWVASEDPAHPGLLSSAVAGNAAAKAELLGQIRERIDYLVRRRAGGYRALDVLRESVHPGRYWQVYGVEGIAQIFDDTAHAVQAAGAETTLYLDELGVLQSSKEPSRDGAARGVADPFANAYRWQAEELRRAGAPLGGLGVHYDADGRARAVLGENAHSPVRIFAALQNLSGTGLELALTDFRVHAGDGVTAERAADLMEETLRLTFGTPSSSAALIGSAWTDARDQPVPASVLFDEHFAATPVGARYEALMKTWDTSLNAPLGADGSVEFAGFYGAYLIQSGGKSGCLSVRKGQTDYELELQPAPRGPSGALRRCRSL